MSRIGPRGPGRPGAAPSRPFRRRVLFARVSAARDERPRQRTTTRSRRAASSSTPRRGASRPTAPADVLRVPLVAIPRLICCASFASLLQILPRAAHACKNAVSCSVHIDQSPSPHLGFGTGNPALAALHPAAAVQPDRQRCGGGSARRSCCSSARPSRASSRRGQERTPGPRDEPRATPALV